MIPIQVQLLTMVLKKLINKGIHCRLLAEFIIQTGLTANQFFDLHSRLQWNELIEQISTQRQLLITLVWLRQGLTYATLGWIFDFSQSYITKIVNKVLLFLLDVTTEFIRIPDSDLRLRSGHYIQGFYAIGAVSVKI